jgi:hypothetical protein
VIVARLRPHHKGHRRVCSCRLVATSVTTLASAAGLTWSRHKGQSALVAEELVTAANGPAPTHQSALKCKPKCHPYQSSRVVAVDELRAAPSFCCSSAPGRPGVLGDCAAVTKQATTMSLLGAHLIDWNRPSTAAHSQDQCADTKGHTGLAHVGRRAVRRSRSAGRRAPSGHSMQSGGGSTSIEFSLCSVLDVAAATTSAGRRSWRSLAASKTHARRLKGV